MCAHPLKRNAVHCAGCHRDFGGVSGFDSHQKWDPFRCLPPPYRGMALDADAVWRHPSPGVAKSGPNRGRG